MPVAIGTILFLDLLLLFAKSGNRGLATVASFIAVILAIIVLHEFGHFVTAKAFGIKVTEFFVGFGPRLWSVRKGETEYGIKAIPAGGYVRIAGMNPFTEEPVEDQPRTFGAKPAWQRFIVLVSGAATHFILALVVMTVYFGFIGPETYEPVVADVEQRLNGFPSPAAEAGLLPGDEIVSIDGRRDLSSAEFIAYTRTHVGQPIDLVVVRKGREVPITITPILSDVNGERFGRLGIIVGSGDSLGRDPGGLVSGAAEAGSFVGELTVGSAKVLGRVFGPDGIGRLVDAVAGGDRGLDDPVGLVGAGRLATQAAEAGDFDVLLFLFVNFNVFIGFLNLLPVPPLDGGHVLLLGIEKVRGRAVDLRRVIPVMAVVAGFLILYTVLLLYADIRNPIPNPFSP
jgi:membrane-associated protease RseP (regulator of RpoE activity)